MGRLREQMQQYLERAAPTRKGIMGIAAPHVSPTGGWQSYRAAYRELTPDLQDRTFVVLGTSHYGQPGKFGLTHKPFETPFGRTRIDQTLVAELEAQPASLVEYYCHAIEHSIEFQVVFLRPFTELMCAFFPFYAVHLEEVCMPADFRKMTST